MLVPPSAAEITQTEARLTQLLHATGSLNREREILDYIASLDAGMTKALLDDLKDQPLINHNGTTLAELMSHWAELDPQAALAWLNNIKDSGVKESCWSGIRDAISAKSSTAESLLAQLKNPNLGLLNMMAPLQDFAKQNPQTALDALRSLPVNNPS